MGWKGCAHGLNPSNDVNGNPQVDKRYVKEPAFYMGRLVTPVSLDFISVIITSFLLSINKLPTVEISKQFWKFVWKLLESSLILKWEPLVLCVCRGLDIWVSIIQGLFNGKTKAFQEADMPCSRVRSYAKLGFIKMQWSWLACFMIFIKDIYLTGSWNNF